MLEIGLGYSGIGLAFSVSLSSEFLITYAFLYLVKDIDKRTLVGFSREDLQGWREYLKYAFSGVALVVIEWWAVQIISLFISRIGEASFAAQTIFTNIYTSIIIIAFGFGTSLNSIIGNALGMNDSKLATLFYKDAMLLASILIVMLLTVLNIWGSSIISSFTSDTEVIRIADSSFIFLTVLLLFDMLQSVLSGVMRALTLFRLAICIMILFLWGVYEPFALGLGVFFFSSLKAIYIIQACASAGLALSYFLILHKQDWRAIAETIHSKMKVDSNEEPLLGE